MKMKKTVSTVLCAALMAASLISCGTADNTTSQNNTRKSGDVTLQFMGWEASVYETEANKACLQSFMDQNPGIKVEYISGPSEEHHTKLLTMMAGGAAPDTFYMDVPFYRQFIEQGQLLDLTDIYQQYYKEEDFLPWSATKSKVGDKFYGIDSCIVGNILFYNRDLFEKANVEMPPSNPDEAWTWEEFLDAAQKLTIKNGDTVEQYGAFGFEVDFIPLQQYLVNMGVTIFNEDYTSCKISDPDKMVDVMQKFKDLRVKYGVAPEANVSSKSGMSANQMLQTGKIAMVNQGSYSMQELANMDFDFGVAPLPTMDGKTMNAVLSSYNVAGWTGTKHKEETLKLISHLASTDFQLPFVQSGLWMSNRVEMYEPENQDQWFNPDVHPAEFVNMTSIFKNAIVAPTHMAGANVRDITDEEIKNFYYNDQDAQTTILNIEKRATEALSK